MARFQFRQLPWLKTAGGGRRKEVGRGGEASPSLVCTLYCQRPVLWPDRAGLGSWDPVTIVRSQKPPPPPRRWRFGGVRAMLGAMELDRIGQVQLGQDSMCTNSAILQPCATRRNKEEAQSISMYKDLRMAILRNPIGRFAAGSLDAKIGLHAAPHDVQATPATWKPISRWSLRVLRSRNPERDRDDIRDHDGCV